MKSCDNCVLNKIPCPYRNLFPSHISHCSGWEGTKEFEMNEMGKKLNDELREEGYEQAIDDVNKYFVRICKTNEQYFGEYRGINSIQELLQRQKKERFHPEPEVKPDLSQFKTMDLMLELQGRIEK